MCSYRRYSLLVGLNLLVQSLLLRGALSKVGVGRANQEEESESCYPPPLIVPPFVTNRPSKLIIAHRGASAHLPEHSLQAYRLALELNADYIEPDIVATKDNELIAVHSMDISITTDVAEKFPERETFSKYLNSTGYWSYEFTLEEIKTLRVRQRLPAARSTDFDGIFGVPTLAEIMELVQEWNGYISPQMINSTTRKAEKGLYVELKDYPWLLEDTGVDLVELLFRHMDENEQLWDSVVFENLCSTKRTDDYRLPPFILQSFEAKVLESFKIQWEDKFKENATDNILRPVPYSILLIPRDKCFDENFWFQVDDTLRDVLSGVGPDKDCLYQYWRQFMERAAKLHLAVHPWTERPEVEYLGGGAVTPTFNTVLDEIVYLFCTVGVHGIFSESVEMAVVAASMPCQEENMDQQIGNVFPNDKRNDGSDSEQSSFYVGFASFSIGVILTVLVGLFVSKGNGHLRKRNDLRGIRIPTVEISHDDDETKTDNMEML